VRSRGIPGGEGRRKEEEKEKENRQVVFDF